MLKPCETCSPDGQKITEKHQKDMLEERDQKTKLFIKLKELQVLSDMTWMDFGGMAVRTCKRWLDWPEQRHVRGLQLRIERHRPWRLSSPREMPRSVAKRKSESRESSESRAGPNLFQSHQVAMGD